MPTLAKFDPRYSLYIRGFDRRGAAASIHSATSNAFTVSGNWADLADFAVLNILDADDAFGHLYTSKYLPDFDLTNVVLDFDLAITNGFYPGSNKFQSVPWGKLSWITDTGTSGTTALNITGTTGRVDASKTFTITTTLAPVAGDRVQIIYLGNVVYDWTVSLGETITTIATGLKNTVNSFTSSSIPLSATSSGPALTITCIDPGTDGNTIELWVRATSTGGTTGITPVGEVKLVGGVDPTSIHVTLDFSSMTLPALRQCWLTLAPPLPIDSGGTNPALVAFANLEFTYAFTNWTVTDPSTHAPLKVADSVKSVVVGSRDRWVTYSGSWTEETGFYLGGFARASSHATDTVTVKYSCQYTHDLYLGTALYSDRGKFALTLDGSGLTTLDCYLNVASQVVTRRKIASGVSAGDHVLVLTVTAGTGTFCYFDCLHAVVATNPAAPASPYTDISAAADWDTDQSGKIPPARLAYVLQMMGFEGDLDFYAGVFYAFKRRRKGGTFLAATVTISGTMTAGDAYFLDISGVTGGLGVGLYATDTVDSVSYRLINAINALFVGVRATRTGTGVLTITTLSPINGFTISASASGGATGTIVVAGAIGALANGVYVGGQEGIWEIDPAPSTPLNLAFSDYLTDLTSVLSAASITFTLAFSLELLAPPDANTSSGAWIQRYNDGTPVLTSTGFGSWGAGYVESVSGSGPYTVKQTGHGYITGYVAHYNGGAGRVVTVVDVDHYTVTVSPTAGQAVYVDLQTSQCAFNPLTVTPYLRDCYRQAAAIIDAGGVIPWLQFGEILHWFFAGGSGPSMAFYDANQTAAATIALGRALHTFSDPNDNPSVNIYADADFLRQRLQDHIHTIQTGVTALTGTAMFELLWPYDVNWLTAYTGPMGQPAIGGQLNLYINLPPDYTAAGSDISRFKIEALAWGTTYRTMANAIASIRFYASDTSWATADVRYLVPWQNGGCPWESEYLWAQYQQIPQVSFWAIDHIVLFSWSHVLPTYSGGSAFMLVKP